MWYVYIVECKDGSYYCGITTNVSRRLAQHNSGKGAKYTRGRGPVRLVTYRWCSSRSEASKLEYLVKSCPKHVKVLTLLLGIRS